MTAACRSAPARELVAARVAVADPTLAPAAIEEAIERTVTNPAVLRDLAAALGEGPASLVAGAPPVVGRLVRELIALGSRLPVPACATCGRTQRPLTPSGSVPGAGVCPRCRAWERAEACARCGTVSRVAARDGTGAARCHRCAERPKRRCGACGEERPIARRARPGGDAQDVDGQGTPDVCVNCYTPGRPLVRASAACRSTRRGGRLTGSILRGISRRDQELVIGLDDEGGIVRHGADQLHGQRRRALHSDVGLHEPVLAGRGIADSDRPYAEPRHLRRGAAPLRA